VEDRTHAREGGGGRGAQLAPPSVGPAPSTDLLDSTPFDNSEFTVSTGVSTVSGTVGVNEGDSGMQVYWYRQLANIRI